MPLIKAWLMHKGVRQAPIHSGYRPMVFFLHNHPTSGVIRLLDREELLPGERALVEITPLCWKSENWPGCQNRRIAPAYCWRNRNYRNP